jgi:hypothetical protein
MALFIGQAVRGPQLHPNMKITVPKNLELYFRTLFSDLFPMARSFFWLLTEWSKIGQKNQVLIAASAISTTVFT